MLDRLTALTAWFHPPPETNAYQFVKRGRTTHITEALRPRVIRTAKLQSFQTYQINTAKSIKCQFYKPPAETYDVPSLKNF